MKQQHELKGKNRKNQKEHDNIRKQCEEIEKSDKFWEDMAYENQKWVNSKKKVYKELEYDEQDPNKDSQV